MAQTMKPPNGTVPNPDPTVRTVEQLQREIAATREIVEANGKATREVLETRLGGMDKAIELLQKAADKIPQHVKDEVAQLRELHEEKFTSVSRQIEIQFGGIATQFQERDKRTEQLSIADKTAIAAALQAQKEAAGSTNESIIAVITKMESSFTKLFDQNQTLLQTMTKNIGDQINDLKSRLDKGEGKTSVSDPAVADAVRQLGIVVSNLTAAKDTNAGHAKGASDNMGYIIGIGGLLFAAAALFFKSGVH